MAAHGFAAAWIFGAGYLLGCISMEVVRRSETRRAIKEAASAAGLRHVTIIENTRGDDGARLLGDIEDALRMVEHSEMGAPR